MRHEPLREARETAGLSLPRMAELVGMDKGNLSKVENGHASASTIERVAARYEMALGITDRSLVRDCGTLPANLVKLLTAAIPGWLCLPSITRLSAAVSRTFVPFLPRPLAHPA